MKNKLLNNICINSDSYKQSHFQFMEPDTTSVFSYTESRTGSKFPETVFFGLQMYLLNYLKKPVTLKMINDAEKFVTAHGLPFNRKGWLYILEIHNGYLPVRIRSVDEGSVVPVGNALITVENTDPNCAWVSNFIETALLRAAWYGTTVATQSREFKKIIKKYLEKTGDINLLPFKLVDFGARGVSSFETSYIGGAAHLINFMSTDNLIGIAASMEYYYSKEITGYSIPASEHSVTTERGRDGELKFFSDAIDTFLGEGKMVSLVSDTYSLKNALKLFGVDLKEKIIASKGIVVVRPDSGNPSETVLFTVCELDKYYGSTINEKGFKVLHPSIRVIQGDGINIDTVEEILKNLMDHGYSADNVIFGSGGGLLQNVTRDTQRFAHKASNVVTNGVSKDIQKVPETDPTKASKAGRLALVKRKGKFMTINENELKENEKNLLKIRYENGKLFNKTNFKKIRKLAEV